MVDIVLKLVNLVWDLTYAKLTIVTMRTAYHARACQVCKCDTTKWYVGEKLLELLGPLKDDYNLASNDWVCEKCYRDIGSSKCTGNHRSRFSQV